jgi:multicomponent Na+:H+ antiporter subunit B
MPEPRMTVELEDDQPSHRPKIGRLLAGAVLGALIFGLIDETRESAPLPAIARLATTTALPLWHTTEPVNAIVYGSRGFDTFAETFLLLAAVIGISTISRHREPRAGFIGEEELGAEEEAQARHPTRGGGGSGQKEGEARAAEAREKDAGSEDSRGAGGLGAGLVRDAAMTVIVRSAARALAPVLLMAGIYLVAWGYSPGGGFPAGAVILGVVLLVYVAYGYRKVERVVRPAVVETAELAGAMLIVAIEVLGLVFKGSFSANWLPLARPQTLQSGGVLQAFSGSELVEVGTGLVLAVFGLLGMGHDWTQGEDEESEGEAR